jgi:hypothetical protein
MATSSEVNSTNSAHTAEVVTCPACGWVGSSATREGAILLADDHRDQLGSPHTATVRPQPADPVR